jgi:nucleotide-binding universal stress UspA family protein
MKVLVAIDSSIYAEEILDQIARRTWPAKSEFRVITAVELAQNWDVQEEFMQQSRIILSDRIAFLKKSLKHYNVVGQVLAGTAAPIIIENAREWKAELIIVGSHGDTGTRKEGIGSVAAAIVDKAPCTVEVVKLRRAICAA